jgi:DNA-binding response OmpR family regulator
MRNSTEKRILVVDDEPVVIDLLKTILDSAGVGVAGATSGEEALRYVRENEVDLVITDLVMPGMSGTKLFFELRKMNPFLQIIFISGNPTLNNIADMFESGASDFILKPFNTNELRSVVKETFLRIDRWRSLRDRLLPEWVKTA